MDVRSAAGERSKRLMERMLKAGATQAEIRAAVVGIVKEAAEVSPEVNDTVNDLMNQFSDRREEIRKDQAARILKWDSIWLIGVFFGTLTFTQGAWGWSPQLSFIFSFGAAAIATAWRYQFLIGASDEKFLEVQESMNRELRQVKFFIGLLASAVGTLYMSNPDEAKFADYRTSLGHANEPRSFSDFYVCSLHVANQESPDAKAYMGVLGRFYEWKVESTDSNSTSEQKPAAQTE